MPDDHEQESPVGKDDLVVDVDDLDDQDLDEVEISDTTIEQDDKQKDNAQKLAKKQAKKLRTPDEKRTLLRKKIAIVSGGLLGAVLMLLIVPATRWTILNFIGFRGNLQITIEETQTKRPITNANVKLEDGTFSLSDTYGRVQFAQTKLGKRTVLIQKSGYGDLTKVVSNGVGTTKTTASLKVIGIKLDFDIKNWLSKQPIQGAQLTFGKSTAKSDQSGRASLVIPPTDKNSVDVEIVADGYLTKTVSTELDAQSREVAMVSSQKDYFISKRDGKFDIFSSNLDGTDQHKIIEATGKEDESLLQFTINKNNKQAVLVATRDGKIQNGKVIAGIYSIDLEKATLKKVDEGSDIQLLDWADVSLVYTKTDPSLNYDDPALSRVMSYNTASTKLTEIAQTNYFSVALLAQNKIFYMPSDPYRSIQDAALTSQDIISGAKKTYLAGKQIAYATRASYNSIELQDQAGANFELQIAGGATKAIDRRPSTSLNIAMSPNGQLAAWSDRRDGQGALLVRNLKTNEEKVIAKSAGLTSPVRFVSDDLIVVRVATTQETADYVVNISNGKLSKIVDLSNVGVVRQGSL